VLRWLGMAGFFINCRVTTLMIDPLLGGFDMPVLIDFPMLPAARKALRRVDHCSGGHRRIGRSVSGGPCVR
jgi:L-ascorbate metabolism protein UlaG (beta-lactamase superfamily)